METPHQLKMGVMSLFIALAIWGGIMFIFRMMPDYDWTVTIERLSIVWIILLYWIVFSILSHVVRRK